MFDPLALGKRLLTLADLAAKFVDVIGTSRAHLDVLRFMADLTTMASECELLLELPPDEVES
jgi:hypothetical protein